MVGGLTPLRQGLRGRTPVQSGLERPDDLGTQADPRGSSQGRRDRPRLQPAPGVSALLTCDIKEVGFVELGGVGTGGKSVKKNELLLNILALP